MSVSISANKTFKCSKKKLSFNKTRKIKRSRSSK